MHITPLTFTPLNLKRNSSLQENRESNITFEGRIFNGLKHSKQQAAGKVFGTLLSISVFLRLHNLSKATVIDGIESEELELVGQKIDTDNPKNIAFVKRHKKSRTPSEKNLNRGQFARLLGVGQHTIEWHIRKGNIVFNEEEKTIDITDPINKLFLETFSKLERKEKLFYTPENYSALQTRLGTIPLEYCLQHGLLIADENGRIDLTNEINKNFMEQVQKKEISHDTYFMSIADYAKKVGVSISTISRAIYKGYIVKNGTKGIDVNNPTNIAFETKIKEDKSYRENRPNLLTTSEVRDLLGFNNSSDVQYYTTIGKLVRNSKGFYDIEKEPNKSFIEGRNPSQQKQKKRFSHVGNKSSRTPEGYISQIALAKQLGITQPTIMWHLNSGHITRTAGKGIDLSDPKNIYFIENFRKGEKFIPMDSVAPAQTSKTQTTKIKETNFNKLYIKELANVLAISPSTTFYHIEQGNIHRDTDEKIDLNNPTNIEFVNKYRSKAQEKINEFSLGELLESLNQIKRMFYTRTSKEVYQVAIDLKATDEKNYNGYLEYSLGKILDTSKLDASQKRVWFNLFKEHIDSRISEEEISSVGYISSTEKLDPTPFLPLINKFIECKESKIEGFSIEEYIKQFQKSEKEPVILKKNPSNEIVEGKSITKYIDITKELYGSKIRALKILDKMSTKDVLDTYLFSRYIVAKHSNRLLNTTRDIKNFRISEDLDLDQAIIIAEKVLTQKISKEALKSKDYQEWKKELFIPKIERFVEEILKIYKRHAITTICPNRAFEMLKSINPDIEMSREQFVDYMMKRFELA